MYSLIEKISSYKSNYNIDFKGLWPYYTYMPGDKRKGQTRKEDTMKAISEHAAAAKAIRAELKKNGIKAKVRSESYSGGNSVHVSLENELPAVVESVKAFAFQYQAGNFNGMEDIYEYNNSSSDLPQVKFVFVENSYSDAIKQAAWDFCRNYWAGMEDAPEKYSEACNWRHAPSQSWGSQLVHRALSEPRGGFWFSQKERVAA